jgi:hypothetical protein
MRATGRSINPGQRRESELDDRVGGVRCFLVLFNGEGGASVVGGTPRRARLPPMTPPITGARRLAPRDSKGVPGPKKSNRVGAWGAI